MQDRKSKPDVERLILVAMVAVPALVAIALWRGGAPSPARSVATRPPPTQDPAPGPMSTAPSAVSPAATSSASPPAIHPLRSHAPASAPLPSPRLPSPRPATRKPRWRIKLTSAPVPDAVASPMDKPGEPAVLMLSSKSCLYLLALDADTGKPVWEAPLRGAAHPGDAVACALPGTVVAYLRSGSLVAFSRATGKRVAEASAPPASGPVAVVGIDHSAATLGGPGAAVQVDASPLEGGTQLGQAHVATAALAVAGQLIAGGRGTAIVQDPAGRVHSLAVPGGREHWSAPLPEAATTGLVRMNYILLGGRQLHVLVRDSGQPLGTLDGPVRRIDERSSWMYILSHTDALRIHDLDTRQPIDQSPGAAAFDYAVAGDYLLDSAGTVRLLRAGSSAVLAAWQLEHPPVPSPQYRLLRNGDRLHVIEDGPALACYVLD